ncbi:MAG: YbaB/EbfC family nucleoid-associated protein [Chlamydiales bacterium]|nr:YbaB/EbfC family nucleoid-associated protein [Chlamydiales bacterium]
MGSGFSKMKKQARMLESQFGKMQDDLKKVEATGEAGNGLVKVILSGDKQVKSIKIAKECVDPEDVEALEDLIQAAFHDALKQLDQQNPMQSLAAGSMPFSL